MEHLDKVIPLVILGVVAVILLILLRRASREQEIVRPREETAKLLLPPVAVVVPIAGVLPKLETPIPAAAPVIIGAPPVEVKKRSVRTLPPVVAAPEPTTIDTVLGLLKNRESLAAAFLLREILDPPLSRRPHPKARR
jgi:hypothetical protein